MAENLFFMENMLKQQVKRIRKINGVTGHVKKFKPNHAQKQTSFVKSWRNSFH